MRFITYRIICLLLIFSFSNRSLNAQNNMMLQHLGSTLSQENEKTISNRPGKETFSPHIGHHNLPFDLCGMAGNLCNSGDFEEDLMLSQWRGAYGYNDSSFEKPINITELTTGIMAGDINSSMGRHSIVNQGYDPYMGIPMVPSGNHALRLGNAVRQAGLEVITKTITVDSSSAIIDFWYAYVFEDCTDPTPGSFLVEVYDCNSGERFYLVDFGSPVLPWLSASRNRYPTDFVLWDKSDEIGYRPWSQAQINLTRLIGKTVTIAFINYQCTDSKHFSYVYLDNISSKSCITEEPVAPEIETPRIDKTNTDSCGDGKICLKYKLPTINNDSSYTGSLLLTLEIYVRDTYLKTLYSHTISDYNSDSSYCFKIELSSIDPMNYFPRAEGFEYRVSARFSLYGYIIDPIYIGDNLEGQTPGYGNIDYRYRCFVKGRDYFSKSTGDLHNLSTWGDNRDGSGSAPANFGEGKIFYLSNRPLGNDEQYYLTGDWIVDGALGNGGLRARLSLNGYKLSIAEIRGYHLALFGSPTSKLEITGSNGGDFGNVPFFGNDVLESLTLNRPGGKAKLFTTGIYDFVEVKAGELEASFSFGSTGRVKPLNEDGNIIGVHSVVQPIPARRAWRFMCSPLIGTLAPQSIKNTWQQYTHITGGSAADGFDQHLTGQSAYSLKTYDSDTDSWLPVTNTYNARLDRTPYMIFIRGDRSIDFTTSHRPPPPSNTRFFTQGSLIIGDQTVSVNGKGFTAIANPFLSPINFATITRNNVANHFYVWDPWMGGAKGVGAWVNVSFNGTGYDVMPTPVSPMSQYIQSGQAFMVRSGNGQPGSLVIKESDKSATPAQNVFRHTENKDEPPLFAPARNAQGLKVKLQKPDSSGQVLLDEVFASYSREFSNTIDEMDVHKISNFSENLAIVRKENLLLVERREEIKEADSLHLKLWNTSAGNYSLHFTPIELDNIESVTLEDKYLRSRVMIDPNKVSDWPFEVNADKTSSAADRFRIIITKKKALPVTSNSLVRVYPNPVHNGNIQVNFEYIPSGRYNLQLMNSAGQVVYNNNLLLAEGNSRQQLGATQQLPAGVYQLKVTGEGSTHVIKVLKH